jgi:AAA15 family ATPase/GTPase
MKYLDGAGVKAKNYKCFGKIPQGFEEILPLNLIIGRNNSGKSALIDLIEYAIDSSKIKDIGNYGFKGQVPEIFLKRFLKEQEIRTVFKDNQSGGAIQGNHYDYGAKWINKPIIVKLHRGNVKEFVSIKPKFDSEKITEDFGRPLGVNVANPFSGKIFKRLYSDRDLSAESEDNNILLSSNGIGATNIIQSFINRSDIERDYVEKDLLNDLNKIFAPDSIFERILAQKRKDNKWEIFLEERNKGRIALSDSGSGLKTVMLVLINLILIPRLENNPIERYVFAFEELENNLHPGLQRRLFNYMNEKVIENNSSLFVTTHSSVVIDLFNKNINAQILHITHSGERSKVRRVVTHIENDGVLDDLDVRASDLLQSNCVIWVEGPSDRVYINRWIDLWSDGELKEGIHYQCVFYGGRLLAHLEADPTEGVGGVKMLKVNRKVIAVSDSDRSKPSQSIGKTKKRIKSEVESVGGLSWITEGREIENYIPKRLFQEIYGVDNLRKLGKYGEISNYLDKIKSKEGRVYLKNKVVFAEKIVKIFSRQDIEESALDLKERVSEICIKIREWNGIA